MSKFGFLKSVMAAGGFMLLCAAPAWALGQSNQPGVAPPAPMGSVPVPRGKAAAPIDLLDGLTLTGEQEAKIDQIRGDTNARMATVNMDKAMDAETAEAMRRGYVRIENGRIFQVLTLEQQKQVRQRIATLKDPKAKPQYPMRRVPPSEPAPKSQ